MICRPVEVDRRNHLVLRRLLSVSLVLSLSNDDFALIFWRIGPGQTADSNSDVTTTSKHISVGAIEGGVIGGAILLLVALLACLCWRRKSRKQNQRQTANRLNSYAEPPMSTVQRLPRPATQDLNQWSCLDYNRGSITLGYAGPHANHPQQSIPQPNGTPTPFASNDSSYNKQEFDPYHPFQSGATAQASATLYADEKDRGARPTSFGASSSNSPIDSQQQHQSFGSPPSPSSYSKTHSLDVPSSSQSGRTPLKPQAVWAVHNHPQASTPPPPLKLENSLPTHHIIPDIIRHEDARPGPKELPPTYASVRR